MNSEIVAIYNDIVKPDDEVYNLGDFAFKTGQRKIETKAIFDSLNGIKYLCKGNHDSMKHIGDWAWREITMDRFITIRGIRFRMAHFPYPDGRTLKDLTERPECMTDELINPETGKVYPLIHGHVHSSYCLHINSINVGWDIFHKPVS